MNTRAAIAAPLLAVQSTLGRVRLGAHAKLLASMPPGAFPPEWHDLWFLYRSVRRLKPKVVLEFGSGCSTPIIAQALHENGGGKIYSVEAFAEWAQATRGYFPRHLVEHCEILESGAVESEHDGNLVWRHAIVPDITPALIYLDGPPLSKERPAAVDVLDVEPRLAPGALLIVDGRKKNFAYLQQKLRRPWRFEWHHVAYRGVAELLS